MWLDPLRRLLGFQSLPKSSRKDSPLRKWRGRLNLERLEDRFAPAAAVYTDKLDYLAGETAVITATGFDVGSVVEFQVVHDPSTPGIPGGQGHEPWSVRDGSPQDGDGLANSTIITTWYVNPDDSVGAIFHLSATGSSGGQLTTATATFTDAPPKADLDHFANLNNGGEYIDGDLNSSKASYLEGDSVPYRIVFSNLLTTETYTITVGYDTTKGGMHAFDYLTTFNRTQASDPLAGVSGIAGATDTEAIPIDPQVTAGPDGSLANAADNITQIPGVFTLFGGTITAVSGYTYSGTYAGDSSAFLSVSFTVNSGGTSAVLAFGAHIATRFNWGPNSSAGAIEGSPYHVFLEDFSDTAGDASTGQQDHQLKSDVVILPATITVIKNTVPDGATDFSFSTTGGLTPATFSLDDDGNNANDLSNTQAFTGITSFTTYTITEQANASFDTAVAVVGASSFTINGNTATINVKEGENVTVTYTNTLRDPKLAIDKIVVGVFNADNTPDADGIAETAGDYIKYDVKVTNTGNVPLTGVIVSDPLLGGTLASGVSLAVGASQTFSGTYTVKQSDLDNRGGGDDDIDNTATADSDQTDPPVSDSESVPLAFNPGLAIDKIVKGVFNADDTPDSDGIADAAGDYIKYDVKVTNTGNVTLTNVIVSDPLLGGTLASGVTLGVGTSQTFTGTYTVKQSDLDNRGGGDDDIDNTATANSDQAGPVSDSEDVLLLYDPKLAIDKIVVGVFNADNTPDSDGIADTAGDYVKYDVKVTNTGNITLTGVIVSDPLLGGTLASNVTLAPGASQTFSGTYTVKQSDLDNQGGGDGDIDNTATADSNQTDPVSDSENVPLANLPDLAIDKIVKGVFNADNTPDGDGIADTAGDYIKYDVKVTNTGNVALTGVTVSDPLLGGTLASGVTLAVGESKTFSGTYTVKQSDLDNRGGGDGDIDNTATANSDQTGAVQDSEEVPLAYNPGLAIDKIVKGVFNANNTPDSDGIADAAGDYIKYDVKVTNTGNVTLTGVIVSDPLLGGTLASGVTLAVGASQTFSGTYTIKQSDLDNQGGGDGDIDNTATADSNQTDPVNDSEEVPLAYDPKLAIDKIVKGVFNADNTPDSDGIADAAGDYIKYDVKVTNTGNVTLTGVSVSDPLLGGTLASNVTLAPGASQTFSGTYTVTQADLVNKGGGDGDIDNTATADSDQTDPVSDSESVPLEPLGSIRWEKRRDDNNYLQGGATFTVTNNATGVLLLTVTDNGPGDKDPDAGQIEVVEVPLGTYTVRETVAPAGFALDDDPTRTVTVSLQELNPVIGTQGQDDPGNYDESDFHNRLGSISWEKRREDTNALQGGATFEIRDAVTNALIKTVTDNDANDADPDAGQLKVTGIPLGTYKVIETVAPDGWARDDDFTRLVTVSSDELYPVIGTQGQDDAGNYDESDFHNRLGKISWEKRRDDTNELQGGATFEIRDAATNELIKTVTDNGAGDLDPDAGQITVKGIKLGTYNVIETVSPAGFALDDDPIRQVTVSDDTLGGELCVVIGTQGQDDAGNYDESDFHNRLGSIEWEKRREDTHELQGGATFTITNNATGVLFITVTDNGPGDEDPDAGQIKVINVPLGSYTVRETVAPAGFALDDDPTRVVKVCAADLYAVIGEQGKIDEGNTDESDFFNRLGSIAWEKRREDTNALQGGATFTVTDNATGNILLTVTDNGANDADPDEGQIKVVNIPLATYTVTETVAPSGWAVDDDPTRIVTVSAGNLNPVIGTQGVVDLGNTDQSDFINRLGKISWEKRRADTFALQGGATFEIRDAETGELFKRVKDNGPGDANPLAGKITVKNVPLGTYTVTEVVPPLLFDLDDDPTRLVTVSDDRNGIDDDGDGVIDDAEELFAVIGRQGFIDFGNSDESDFFDPPKDFSKKDFIL